MEKAAAVFWCSVLYYLFRSQIVLDVGGDGLLAFLPYIVSPFKAFEKLGYMKEHHAHYASNDY